MTPASGWSEGQMHDSSAEVVDAPLLVLRMAHSRAEATRLIDWIRGIGLGGEGQISQALLRRALTAIGVHSPTLSEHIDDLFQTLDPEMTGTISLSELASELRRVRKLIVPSGIHGGPGMGDGGRMGGSTMGGGTMGGGTGGAGRRGGALVRGRSAPPHHRGGGGGLGRSLGAGGPHGWTHPDGTPFSALDLERVAVGYRRQGELGQALRALEAALAIHQRVHGDRSEVTVECSRQVADVCNSLGMQMLQRDDFVGCHALLRRAQARGEGDRAMFAITLNNLACYHRRRGHLKVALAHLAKAVEIEASCGGGHKPADTHLNLCAVQSELGAHHQAMHHAKFALRLLREELGLPMRAPHGTPLAGGGGRGFGLSLRPQSASSTASSAAGLLTGGGGGGGGGLGGGAEDGGGALTGGLAGAMDGERRPAERSSERMAVLAIAHHNLAVEQEALSLPDEASRSYAEAAAIATEQLGEAHPVAIALNGTNEANMQQRERQLAAQMRSSQLSARPGSAQSSLEARRAAELRKQASVQRHIEQTRLMRSGSRPEFKFRPHEKRVPGGVPKILSEVGDDGDVAGALREWLHRNAKKVMNLFQEWDFDGNGTIDLPEFKKAMKALGLHAPAPTVEGIFAEFDADGGGLIDFKEMNKILRQGSVATVVKKVVHAQVAVRGMQEDVKATKARKQQQQPSQRPGSAPPRPSLAGGDGRDDGYATGGDPRAAPGAAAPRPTSASALRPSAVAVPDGGGGEEPEADDVANAEEEEDFATGNRQNAMEFDDADANRDTKLDFDEFSKMIREREEGEHTEAELRARFASMDANDNQRIDLDEFIAFSLRDALARSSTRVIDLFRDWDDDQSGSIDLKEFKKALRALGFEAPEEEVLAVFAQMDKDKSGTVEYKELNKMLRSGAGSTLDPKLQPGAVAIQDQKSANKHALRRGKMSGKKNAVLASSVKLEPISDGKSVAEQLREILNSNAVRVIDLFRAWDEDGNGKITAKEFKHAIAALGYSAPKADCDAVFATFDIDNSGEVDYHELNKALRRQVELDPSLKAGAVAIELTAKNKSPTRAASRSGTGSNALSASIAGNIKPKARFGATA